MRLVIKSASILILILLLVGMSLFIVVISMLVFVLVSSAEVQISRRKVIFQLTSVAVKANRIQHQGR